MEGTPWIDEDSRRDLAELIARAKREKKWLYCSYRSLWFSPDELTKENDIGHFRWGAVNWELRDPEDNLAYLRCKVQATKNDIEAFQQRMKASA